MKRAQSKQSDVSGENWECQACTFNNHARISQCEICSNPKSSIKSETKVKDDGKGDFNCHSCGFEFQSLVSECPNCHQVLIPPQEDQKEDQIKSAQKPSIIQKMIACPSCGEDNDPKNQICVFCQSQLVQKKIQSIPMKKRAPRRAPKPRAYRRGVQTCQYCKMAVYGTTLQAHQAACTHISNEQLSVRYLTVQKKYCCFCYQKLKSQQYEDHQKTCSTRKQFYSSDGNPTYKRCTKLQIDTMMYMHRKSQKLHWIAQQSLVKRIVGLGYKPSDLQNLHHYIVNYAPIIIHMHVNSHMQFFVKDTHYRNQFETRKSSGSLSQSSRTSWEDRMFDKMHHSATPFERVKYGTINFTNDPKGVRACVGYGQSYFLLKPHVRNRCTVTDMDSSSPSATIATFQFCYHLLNKLPDAELKAAFDGSKANQIASSVIGAYKQIQIHGPVQFKQDIERVYVNKAELTDPKFLQMVKQFCKKNDLEYEQFGYQEPKPAASGLSFGFGSASSFSGGYTGGLFGYSSPAPATSFFSSPPPPPITYFSAPVMTSTTTHLFRGSGASYPYASGIVVPPRTEKKKQQKEGIDYI